MLFSYHINNTNPKSSIILNYFLHILTETSKKSCGTELKGIVLDMIKLLKEVDFLEEYVHNYMKRNMDLDIRDKNKLETFVCQIEGFYPFCNLHLKKRT